MAITDLALRKAKPQDKPYTLRDADGLYVVVTPAGGKLWRYDYRFDGKYRTLSYGKYPFITVAQARAMHLEARQNLAIGIDPGAKKQAAKIAKKNCARDHFRSNRPIMVRKVHGREVRKPPRTHTEPA